MLQFQFPFGCNYKEFSVVKIVVAIAFLQIWLRMSSSGMPILRYFLEYTIGRRQKNIRIEDMLLRQRPPLFSC